MNVSRRNQVIAVVGGISLILGSFDPLEGSVLILAGSGLLALASFLRHDDRRLTSYRAWSFILVAIGVAALFSLSALGGVGGTSSLSAWWALLITPYVVGWSLDLWGPGIPRWISAAGIVIGTWYVALLAVVLWGMRDGASLGEVAPALLIGAFGATTIVACGFRLRSATPASPRLSS